jgi:hypothetical protein
MPEQLDLQLLRSRFFLLHFGTFSVAMPIPFALALPKMGCQLGYEAILSHLKDNSIHV